MQGIRINIMNITRLIFPLLLVLIFSGCSQTKYTGYKENTARESPLSRIVTFKIYDQFYENSPTCVTILPTKGYKKTIIWRKVEESFARHLTGKVDRVISPQERDYLERELGLDLENSGDRKQFGKLSGCNHYAQVKIEELQNMYALVWSQRKLTISLKMHPWNSNNILWEANHTASRGNGGIPLSPLSLGGALFNAGKEQADAEIMLSMIDDSFRRLLRKIPDTRMPGRLKKQRGNLGS